MNSTRHFMLDLETMGTSSNAAIIQIGCAVFYPLGSGVLSRFKQTVTLQSSLALGLMIDLETVKWWRGQASRLPPHSKDQPSALAEAGLSIGESVVAFDNWYHAQAGWAEMPIWSNGAAFDIPIIETAYRLLDMRQPWHYRNSRCQRTLLATALALGWQKPDLPEASHDALEDCAQQVALVQAASKHLDSHVMRRIRAA